MTAVSQNIVTTTLLRPTDPSDADAIIRIYQEGIETGNATFSSSASSWEDWDEGHLEQCRITAEEDGEIVGWAALSDVSNRCVYAGVAEVSIYVSASALGRGVGSKLLKALIKESEKQGIWTLQAGIFPENEASITLHQNLGFRIVGIREKLGRMSHGPLKDTWRDVVFLEKRSAVSGTD